MVVPRGSGVRLGIDKDRDELDAGSDPMDPDSVPRLERPLDTPRPGAGAEVSVHGSPPVRAPEGGPGGR